MNFKKFMLSTLTVMALVACGSKDVVVVTEFRKEPITIEAKNYNSRNSKNYNSRNSNYSFSGVDKNGQVYYGNFRNCFNYDYYRVGTQYLIPIRITNKVKKTENGMQTISTKETLSPCGENAQITNNNNGEPIKSIS